MNTVCFQFVIPRFVLFVEFWKQTMFCFGLGFVPCDVSSTFRKSSTTNSSIGPYIRTILTSSVSHWSLPARLHRVSTNEVVKRCRLVPLLNWTTSTTVFLTTSFRGNPGIGTVPRLFRHFTIRELSLDLPPKTRCCRVLLNFSAVMR